MTVSLLLQMSQFWNQMPGIHYLWRRSSFRQRWAPICVSCISLLAAWTSMDNIEKEGDREREESSSYPWEVPWSSVGSYFLKTRLWCSLGQSSEAGFCLLCVVPCVEGIKVGDVAMNLGLFKKSQEPLSDMSLLVLSVGGNWCGKIRMKYTCCCLRSCTNCESLTLVFFSAVCWKEICEEAEGGSTGSNCCQADVGCCPDEQAATSTPLAHNCWCQP